MGERGEHAGKGGRQAGKSGRLTLHNTTGIVACPPQSGAQATSDSSQRLFQWKRLPLSCCTLVIPFTPNQGLLYLPPTDHSFRCGGREREQGGKKQNNKKKREWGQNNYKHIERQVRGIVFRVECMGVVRRWFISRNIGLCPSSRHELPRFIMHKQAILERSEVTMSEYLCDLGKYVSCPYLLFMKCLNTNTNIWTLGFCQTTAFQTYQVYKQIIYAWAQHDHCNYTPYFATVNHKLQQNRIVLPFPINQDVRACFYALLTEIERRRKQKLPFWR